MAMMVPISGLSEFVSVLAQLEHGERAPYPFYCALLYTVAEGVDFRLARYVDENWDELDAMTGDRCLVFVIGDVRSEPAAGHRPFSAEEIYRVADHLGVRASSLPCAAFFSRPDQSREMLRLRLSDYLVAPEIEPSAQSLTRAFRGIASAITTCSELDTEPRLGCLREELTRERARMVATKSSEERLSDAASSAGSIEKVVVSGTTIAATVLRVLGLVL